MAFDESLRKLISGAHNGTVGIWNFNNGKLNVKYLNLFCCNNFFKGFLIQKFKADPDAQNGQNEISAIIHKNERLCISSWNKTVLIYHLGNNEVQFAYKYPLFHSGIILSMDIHLKKLVTAAYDGKIIFWSIEMGLPSGEFQLKNSTNLEFVDRTREIIKNRKDNLIYEIMAKDKQAPVNINSKDLLENNNHYANKVTFLRTRVIHSQIANFLSAGALGWVKAWSTNANGHMLGQFNAAHNPHDNISTFCLDRDEMVLFTGLFNFI